MNTWAKAKKTADKAKDESEDNLSDDDKPLPKKSRKRRKGSDALNFLQEQGEREEERRLEELSIAGRWLPLKQSAKIFFSTATNAATANAANADHDACHCI